MLLVSSCGAQPAFFLPFLSGHPVGNEPKKLGMKQAIVSSTIPAWPKNMHNNQPKQPVSGQSIMGKMPLSRGDLLVFQALEQFL